MATAVNTIEVAVPEGAAASPEDVELLGGLFRAITALRFDSGRDWPRIRRALERSGWSVTWSLQWHVEARRGREMEQACGPRLDDAFASVWQVVGHEVPTEGTP